MTGVEIRFGYSKTAKSEMNMVPFLMLALSGICLAFYFFGIESKYGRAGLLAMAALAPFIGMVLLFINAITTKVEVVLSSEVIKLIRGERTLHSLEWDEIEELMPLGSTDRSSFRLSSDTKNLVVSNHFESIKLLRRLCEQMPDADEEERIRLMAEAEKMMAVRH